MKEVLSDIEEDEIFEDVEVIPVYSNLNYNELFSRLDIFTTVVPPVSGVWQWESGLIVQWESGANVDLE